MSLEEKAKKLTNLFYEIEGRRPRVLVGDSEVLDSQRFKEISSLFADLGCDVDLSPKILKLNHLVAQSQENDTDIILICSHKIIKEEELIAFSNEVQHDQPHIVFALYAADNEHIQGYTQKMNNWMLFSGESNNKNQAFEILSRLLEKSKSDDI